MLRVVSPGVLATVQDAGRPGYAHVGVPHSGACDPAGLEIADALVDAEEGAAAIEVTVGGLELAVLATTVVGIGGADLGAEVVEEGRALHTGRCHLVWAGTTIAFRGRAAGTGRGARAYLALPGGIDVPRVLGSASTCLVGRFGGFDGRALQPGDLLAARRGPELSLAGRSWPAEPPTAEAEGPSIVRILLGPHGRRFAPGALAALESTVWTARSDSDRMGIRLAGSRPLAHRGRAELVSLPMTWGAIQVPPDGMPIVLLADHQTVGGYPVVGVVIRADRPIVGQLAPGDEVRFLEVDPATAAAAWRAGVARFAAIRSRLGAGTRWDDAWRWAGA